MKGEEFGGVCFLVFHSLLLSFAAGSLIFLKIFIYLLTILYKCVIDSYVINSGLTAGFFVFKSDRTEVTSYPERIDGIKNQFPICYRLL